MTHFEFPMGIKMRPADNLNNKQFKKKERQKYNNTQKNKYERYKMKTKGIQS